MRRPKSQCLFFHIKVNLGDRDSVTWKVTLLDHVFQVDFQCQIIIFRDQKEYECELGATILVRGRRFLFDIQKYFFWLSVRSILLALVSFMMDYSRIIRFDFLKDNPLIRNMIDLLWIKSTVSIPWPHIDYFGQFWRRTFTRSINAVNGKGLQISGNRGFYINSLGSSPSPLEVNYRKSDIPRVKFGFYLRARIKLNWFINK